MTSGAWLLRLRFFLGSTLRHTSLQASSRNRPIARDRRGSVLSLSGVIDPGYSFFAFESSSLRITA
jgi:hypothetical protein